MFRYLTLRARPQNVKEEDFRKYIMITAAGSLTMLIHCVLACVFFASDIYTLALLNVGSVLVWCGGLYLNAKGQHDVAVYLFCTELAIHSICTTAFLGTAFGFQHYLWGISALAILSIRLSICYSIAYSLIHIFIFALLYTLFSPVEYTNPYLHFAPWVHFSNILISGALLTSSIATVRYIAELEKQRLSTLARVDHLTGLSNRHYAYQVAHQKIKEAQKTKNNLCFVLGDIDHFKKINDTFGHQEGDRVLKQVSTLLRELFRKEDLVARWGGEEFLFIIPQSNEYVTLRRIQEAGKRINQEITIPHATHHLISMSFGITCWKHGKSLDDCLELADQALYHSKQNGRNCATLSNLSLQTAEYVPSFIPKQNTTEQAHYLNPKS